MVRVLILVAGLALASAGVLLLLWILWLLWKHSEQDTGPRAIEIELPHVPTPEPSPVKEEPEVVAEAEVEVEAEPARRDDLKRLEGIGPKISGVLQAAGITTFAQLADANTSQLRQILAAEDPRLLSLADPTTWPEQAALAATGEWDALGALQQELKGGRRR